MFCAPLTEQDVFLVRPAKSAVVTNTSGQVVFSRQEFAQETADFSWTKHDSKNESGRTERTIAVRGAELQNFVAAQKMKRGADSVGGEQRQIPLHHSLLSVCVENLSVIDKKNQMNFIR